MFWDFIVGVLIIYSVVIIPYRIGFNQSGSKSSGVFESIIDVFFFVDILINFNTAVDDPQTDLLIVSRQSIASKYIEFWFWIDLLSTIPFDQVFSFFAFSSTGVTSIRLIRIARLARLLKLTRVVKLTKISSQFENLDVNPALFGISRMIVQIWFFAHVLCCFWYFIALPEQQTTHYNDNADWVTSNDMQDSNIGDKYMASFYFIITSMLAIGYGDFHATNTTEMVYAMVVMITGSILFGAVIAQVNRMIESRNPTLKAFKLRMNELRAYLSERNLTNSLRNKATVCI
jgi:hypothetical protein